MKHGFSSTPLIILPGYNEAVSAPAGTRAHMH